MNKKQITKEQLITRLRQGVDYYGSQYKYADALGISQPFLHNVLSGAREPSKKLLDAMNLRRVVSYEEAKV